MTIVLRDYQLDAVEQTNDAINAGALPLCVSPTGSGKSLMIAELLRRRRQKTLVLSHTAKLLKQDAAALASIAPHMRTSFFAASIGKKDGSAPIVFATIQSAVRSLTRLHQRALIVVDEAHLCPRSADAMYARLFDYFPEAQRVGFTATPKRMDSGSLISGDDSWFDSIAFEIGARDLIKRKFLVPLSGVLTVDQADLSRVHTQMGEFKAGEAENAVLRTIPMQHAVAQAVALAHRRRSWLVFAAGKRHAEQLRAEMESQGVSCAVVFGETKDDEREALYDRFERGSIRALINVGVLTTGFDAPHADCIISMRPTKSDVLWTQILGRGMRLFPDKKNCLLLDFVGNLERLGGVDCVTEIEDQRVKRPAPTKKPGPAKNPRSDPALMEASRLDPMKTQQLSAKVLGVRYQLVRSKKYEHLQLVQAIYTITLVNLDGVTPDKATTAFEYILVEHGGALRAKAVAWFKRRGYDAPKDARTAVELAGITEAPSSVDILWDRKMGRYLVSDVVRIEEPESPTPPAASQSPEPALLPSS